jgi:crotonobetainyl-CoA:carnitine CoA-transferase CaiB-like acyl-CoA transferase
MSAGAEQGAAGYLSGMSVLDLGQLHPGPYTAMLLGQLGATVIKVEKPQGDTARQLEPRPSPSTTGASSPSASI